MVQNGQITFRWADREETYGAGDAYYAAPGHLPLIAAGTSLLEFSPSDDLQQTMDNGRGRDLSGGGRTRDDSTTAPSLGVVPVWALTTVIR